LHLLWIPPRRLLGAMASGA